MPANLFEQAIALDPKNENAHADLAYAYLAWTTPPAPSSSTTSCVDLGTDNANALAAQVYDAIETPKFFYNDVHQERLQHTAGPADARSRRLDPSLATPGASKVFKMTFVFNQDMDIGSVMNLLNWSITKADGSSNGVGGTYNDGAYVNASKQAEHPDLAAVGDLRYEHAQRHDLFPRHAERHGRRRDRSQALGLLVQGHGLRRAARWTSAGTSTTATPCARSEPGTGQAQRPAGNPPRGARVSGRASLRAARCRAPLQYRAHCHMGGSDGAAVMPPPKPSVRRTTMLDGRMSTRASAALGEADAHAAGERSDVARERASLRRSPRRDAAGALEHLARLCVESGREPLAEHAVDREALGQPPRAEQRVRRREQRGVAQLGVERRRGRSPSARRCPAHSARRVWRRASESNGAPAASAARTSVGLRRACRRGSPRRPPRTRRVRARDRCGRSVRKASSSLAGPPVATRREQRQRAPGVGPLVQVVPHVRPFVQVPADAPRAP